jgi:hypothetical protein
MLREVQRHLDVWSAVIILTTFLMFVAALFLKGLGHDLLLEGGVSLISVKLIMMAYKKSVIATQLNDRLAALQSALARIEGFLEPCNSPRLARGRPTRRCSRRARPSA